MIRRRISLVLLGLLFGAALAAAPAYAHHRIHHFHHFHGFSSFAFFDYPYYPYYYPYYYPPPPPPPVVYSEPPTVIQLSKPSAGEENCREYQTTINVEGKAQPAYGTVCRQPDGTWRFAQ